MIYSTYANPLADANIMRKYLRLIRLSPLRRRRATRGLAARVLRDERGGQVLEYALILGLIVVGCIAVISCVGTKVLHHWNSVNSSV